MFNFSNSITVSLIQDFINILLRSIDNLVLKELWTTILIGVGLAAVCWVVCNFYTRLWNKKYHLTLTHHILCGVAGLFTFFFVIAFSGLTYLKDVSILILNIWNTQILSDNAWAANTFQTAFYKVKDNGLENFTNVPLPGNIGSHIPVNNNTSKEQCAIIYTNEACSNFNEQYPFLSKIIWTSTHVPEEVIKKDMYEYFKSNPSYPPQRAIALAASYIREGLIEQTPRVVTIARLILIVLFIFVQFIPFGLIGYAAYKDIKVVT